MKDVSGIAISIFIAFVLVTLAITAWASRRARSTAQFYAAGGSITPWQNGLAIAGDYLSAASFLGTISVFFGMGIDGLLYAVGAAAGWPVATCLVAERLRKLGKYTVADVLCTRFSARPVRAMTALITITICGSYLVSQMVGAGTLVQMLFDIPYGIAIVIVGALMTLYVLFGGMVATTWIQIIKAGVLLLATVTMAALLLWRFGGSFSSLVDSAALTRVDPATFLRPGGLLTHPFDGVGLALAFALGPAGMPHVLMRFFTVPDARSARRSLVNASLIIVAFQMIVVLLGVGAVALVDAHGGLAGGANMAAVHLARQLGGAPLFGVVAAVAFATILAVVSGLTLAAASAVSHDLYRTVFRTEHIDERRELNVSRAATVAIGGLAILAGFTFQHENIGFLATLPLVLAASSNLPILLLAMYWKRLTTAGAVAGGIVGLSVSVVLVMLSPKVWVNALGHAAPAFPYEYPTVISLGAALFVAWFVSINTRERLQPG